MARQLRDTMSPQNARAPVEARPLHARGWIAGLVLAAATIGAHLPALSAGYVWDDSLLLTDNPLIKAKDGLYRFWFTAEAPDYFPLTETTLWIDWRIWGDHPMGYHL